MQGHYDRAEKDFEESSNLDPEKNSAYIGLGLTHMQTGDTTQAISLLRKRLVETPDDANLLYLLGEALERSSVPDEKNFTEGQLVLEKSERLNSQMCLPHISLGKIYLREGKLQDAVTQFEQARLIDPGEKSAYSHLAVAYRRLGQLEKASATVNALKTIDDQERENPVHRIRSVDETSTASSPNDFK